MTTFNYIDGTPVAKFTIKGPKGEKEVTATVDSGASKSLVPMSIAIHLGLKLKEVVDDVGVCPEPVKVNVYWAEVHFMKKTVTDTVLALTCLLVETQKNTRDA